MKGTRRNNLYYYNGSIVTGVVATISGSDEDSEITSLLHKRLGHAGERALFTLMKRGLFKGEKTCKLEFCDHYALEKQRRVTFGTAIDESKTHLFLIHFSGMFLTI